MARESLVVQVQMGMNDSSLGQNEDGFLVLWPTGVFYRFSFGEPEYQSQKAARAREHVQIEI